MQIKATISFSTNLFHKARNVRKLHQPLPRRTPLRIYGSLRIQRLPSAARTQAKGGKHPSSAPIESLEPQVVLPATRPHQVTGKKSAWGMLFVSTPTLPSANAPQDLRLT